jgi:hypothetical protein
MITVFLNKATKAMHIFCLDFAKAFDKVPRRRLTAKLRAKDWTQRW